MTTPPNKRSPALSPTRQQDTKKGDPMEDFLAREKAALAALEEAADCQPSSSANAMQIDSGVIDDDKSMEDEEMGQFEQPLRSPSTSARIMTSNSPPTTVHTAPSLTATTVADLNSRRSLPTSPTLTTNTLPLASLSIRGNRPETDAMREWRISRNQQLAERDAQQEQTHSQRQTKAAEELSAWRQEWQRMVEERARSTTQKQASNGHDESGNQIRKSEWDDERPVPANVKTLSKDDVNWGAVKELIESLPKPAKDVTRLNNIIRAMAETQKKT